VFSSISASVAPLILDIAAWEDVKLGRYTRAPAGLADR
jgi:hypothetical protein